jgi:hypothetical protein
LKRKKKRGGKRDKIVEALETRTCIARNWRHVHASPEKEKEKEKEKKGQVVTGIYDPKANLDAS